jgi:hypothetical protein
MEPTNGKSEERNDNVPETDGALSANDLDKIAGGRANDPCEGGEFHSR